MNKTKTFSTDSFMLAAFLLSAAIPMIGRNNTNPKRIIFVFEESKLREELTEKFFAHKALVEPHSFFNAQKDLKQMIYSDK